MVNSRKQTAKFSNKPKEFIGIEILSEPITADEEKHIGPIPLINESSFVFWKR